jgi:hypothetical protein
MLLLQVEVLGLPPTQFLESGQRTMDYFDGDDTLYIKVQSQRPDLNGHFYLSLRLIFLQAQLLSW